MTSPSPAGAQLERRARLAQVLVVYLAALASHVPSLPGAFLYDDSWTIVENAFIKQPSNLTRLFDRETLRVVPDANRPLMILSLMLDHQLWGLRPAGYHLQSLLWHCAAAVLVLFLCRRLFGGSGLPLWTALLFAVHPAPSEAVAAINYREDLIATVFLLGAWLLLERARERRSRSLLAGACALLALAALAKETAIAMPLLVVASDALRAPAGAALRGLRARLLEYGLLLAVALAPLLLLALGARAAVASDPATPAFGARLWLALDLLGRYLGQLLLPLWQSAEYTPAIPSLAAPAPWLGLLLLALLVAGALRLRRAWPPLAVGLAWFPIALLPTANLVAIHNPRADRYLYLPAVGICLGLGFLLDRLAAAGGSSGRRRVRIAIATACVVSLGLACALRVAVFGSPLQLWSTTVASAPGSTRAWAGLAFAWLDSSRPNDALAAAERGLALSPSDLQLRMARAIAIAELGERERAIALLDELLAAPAPPGLRARLHNNRGVVLERLGRLLEAERAYAEALRLAPDSQRYLANRARVLARLRR